MRNRGKCKKCNDIIESFHRHDFVTCSCGDISLDGGQDYFRVLARDWNNFVRIDDEDKEIPVKVVDKPEPHNENLASETPSEQTKLTKEEKLKALDEMIKSYENLPPQALTQPCTHYDVLSVLLLSKSLFSED